MSLQVSIRKLKGASKFSKFQSISILIYSTSFIPDEWSLNKDFGYINLVKKKCAKQ